MLRTTVLGLAATSAILLAPQAHADAFVSTASIDGSATYSSEGLQIREVVRDLGIPTPVTSPAAGAALALLGPNGYNLGLALSLTDFDIDLPDVNESKYWYGAIDFKFETTYLQEGVDTRQNFEFEFSDSFFLGEFSINEAADAIADITFTDLADLEANFLNLVSAIPPLVPIDGPAPGFNPIGAVLLTDDIFPDPSLILLLQRDPLQFLGLTDLGVERAIASISADLTLTAVPEPASLALLGMGLAGLGIASRRRKA